MREFPAIDRDLARCLDTHADASPINLHDRDHDVVADHDLFIAFPGQD
jgi:hypothetical protein